MPSCGSGRFGAEGRRGDAPAGGGRGGPALIFTQTKLGGGFVIEPFDVSRLARDEASGLTLFGQDGSVSSSLEVAPDDHAMLALMVAAQQLGKNVIPVVEKLKEFTDLKCVALTRHGSMPASSSIS